MYVHQIGWEGKKFQQNMEREILLPSKQAPATDVAGWSIISKLSCPKVIWSYVTHDTLDTLGTRQCWSYVTHDTLDTLGTRQCWSYVTHDTLDTLGTRQCWSYVTLDTLDTLGTRQCSTRRDQKPHFCDFTLSGYMLVTLYHINLPSSGNIISFHHVTVT